ncbi:MAG: hypothetical protein V1816_25060 [Pseudomonadota bacterium]
MREFPDLDLTRVRTYSIKERPSKVDRRDFATPWKKGGSFSDFLDRLPRILAGRDFLELVDRIVRAVQDNRTIILAMGGHPVKVGLAPLIIDLMNRGIISLLAVNGSVMVHDAETAMVGFTSEDVAGTLGDGTFGMGREANLLINRAAVRAAEEGLGLGRALGLSLAEGDFPYQEDSLFAAGARLGLPVTVHVALGTDVYQIHPEVDGAALGQAGLRDFRTLCRAVADLEQGVFLNLGSAVIMPEVFLKAVTLARNLGRPLQGMTTANMDFIQQYRPRVNVVQRPVAESGRGFDLVGRHELMFPLLAAAVLEKLG